MKMWTLNSNRLAWGGLCLVLCLMLSTLTACTEHEVSLTPAVVGRGSIAVLLQGNQTRATTSTITREEADLFLVTLYKGEDLLTQQVQLGSFGTLTFPAGYGYRLTVENITLQEAEEMNDGWGAKRYLGTSRSFGVQAGQTTRVGVSCSVANAAVAINIGEDVEGCTVTLTSGDRTLTTQESRVAYFNVPSDAKPQVTLSIEKDGQTVTKSLQLDAAQVKDVNVKTGSTDTEQGRLGFSVTYDDTFETVEAEIEIE